MYLATIAISVALLCSVHIAACSSLCCCGGGWPIFDANLTSGESSIAPESGLSWTQVLSNPGPRRIASQTSCDKQGVLRIVFPQACNHMQKRRLQFDLYFDSTRSGWNFDISDSTGDGYGGDAGHTSNAAEVHNINEAFFVYTNTLPGYTDYSTNGLLVENSANALSNHITVTIGDEYVMFDNNRGLQKTYRSEYLFTLSGQATTYGSVDYVIYFSMNRVITSASRSGTGLCRAVIKALDC